MSKKYEGRHYASAVSAPVPQPDKRLQRLLRRLGGEHWLKTSVGVLVRAWTTSSPP